MEQSNFVKLPATSHKLQEVHRQLVICSLKLVAFFCLLACTSKSSETSSPKFQQYFIQGEQLYLQHCSNCHQKNGRGLGLIYPPLDTSDYMQNNVTDVLCLIRNGKSGEVIVNGKNFNQKMPGITTLSDLEIAEIATYIFNSWSHKQGLLEVREVSKILLSCDSLAKKID